MYSILEELKRISIFCSCYFKLSITKRFVTRFFQFVGSTDCQLNDRNKTEHFIVLIISFVYLLYYVAKCIYLPQIWDNFHFEWVSIHCICMTIFITKWHYILHVTKHNICYLMTMYMLECSHCLYWLPRQCTCYNTVIVCIGYQWYRSCHHYYYYNIMHEWMTI